MDNLIRSALWYANHGWLIHPLAPGDKVPLTAHGFKDATNDVASIRAWWNRWPQANIGLACGRSGLVVLDDDEGVLRDLDLARGDLETVTSITRRGVHLFYRCPADMKIGNSRGALPEGIDVRAAGGYVVLPPSMHPSGHVYRWELKYGPHEMEPLELPLALLRLLRAKKRSKKKPLAPGEKIVKNRNNTLTSLAGSMRRRGLSYEAILSALLVENNLRCAPPLPEAEVVGIAKSVSRYEPAQTVRAPAGKQADLLLDLAQNACDLFMSPTQDAYCRVKVDDHVETHKLRTNLFRSYLATLFLSAHGSIPGAQAIEDCMRVLEWSAKAKTEALATRVGQVDDKVFIDLCQPGWEVVEVSAEGWRVVTDRPVSFRRTKSMSALPVPEGGIPITALRSFVNVKDEDWPLFVACLVAYLHPQGPYPVLVLQGRQGSAKSMTQRIVKELIDPNSAPLRGQPEDIRDLMITVNNNWLASFDNVSRVPAMISDALCRISTGGGYSTRQLYTDDEELVLNVVRPVVINCITNVVTRSDLLDRSIILPLPRIEGPDRLSERVFFAEFDARKGALFGSLLDLLVVALRQAPGVSIDVSPRMADFARIGMAIAPQLGMTSDGFLALYNMRRNESSADLVHELFITEPIQELVHNGGGQWSGSSTELLGELRDTQAGQQIHDKMWPQNARSLSALLNRTAPDLEAITGIEVASTRSNGRRIWILQGERAPDSIKIC